VRKLLIICTLLFLIVAMFSVEIVSQSYEEKKGIIYIDPGHGGSDGGAIGKDGTYESFITLIIALKLARVLTKDNYQVYLTRNGDYDLASDKSKNRKRDDIYERVRRINTSDAQVYVSIHANAFPSSKIKGAQVFYKSGNSDSQSLAYYIQDALILEMLNTYRLAKSITDVYLVDHVIVPGCLIEVGFLSNETELANLKKDTYQDKIVHAIYLGIQEYLQNKQ
jgi:N-acetylmuramoyl-L-alanine amidase